MTADAPTQVPPHDPAAWRHVPASSVPVDAGRVQAMLAAEWERFTANTPGSKEHNVRASESLPLGVTSSFQHWDPYPISIVKARGAWLTDVDNRQLLDLSMGFGAMLVGHLNPTVVAKVTEALEETGTLFVTPSPSATVVAERFQQRFSLDRLRFTNSGTEATMYAVRTARAYTGKKAIVKIEGGYHGGYDGLSVSVKPAVEDAGPEDAPIPVVPFDVEPGTVHVVPYNDLPRLQYILAEHADEVCCRGHGAGAREHRHRAAGSGLPRRRSRGLRRARRPPRLRRGQDRPDRGLRGRVPAAGRQARPGHPRQEHRRRPAAGGLRRHRGGHGGRRRQPHAALRHLQRQPARHGRGSGGRRGVHP